MQERHFSNYVEGKESGESLPFLTIASIDNKCKVTVPDSDLTELMSLRDSVTAFDDSSNCLRFKNSARSVSDRISIVRELFEDFKLQQELLIEWVNAIHGTSRQYLARSIDDLEQWVDNLESFVRHVNEFSLRSNRIPFSERKVLSPYVIVTAGNFEAYEAFFLIAQTILSGTHLIIRPSAHDFATHIVFDIIAKKGLTDLGQKLTWDSEKQPDLIKHLIRFAPGASIFGSDNQIESMLRTSILERFPDGHIEERVIEDLSEGRQIKAYGSGNSMLVVMDKPKLAARHFYDAKVIAKGNKCWVPDGAIVIDRYEDVFYRELVEIDSMNIRHRPAFRREEIRDINNYLAYKMAKQPDNADTYADDNSLGILIYRNLQSDSPFFDEEITFPAAGIISVKNLEGAVVALNEIARKRAINEYLSLGYFGPEQEFALLRSQVPSEAYHFNESLQVDLMEPHQGSYFMIDPTVN